MTHKANINIMLITAALLLVTISVAGSGSTDTGTSATMLSFTAQDLKVVAGKTGEAVFICDEVQWLNRAGEPRIPWKVITVLLPPDVEPSSVSACTEAIRYEPIAGTWKVPPTAPMVTWHNGQKIVSWPEDKTLIDGADVDIYRRDALWPEADVRLLCTGQLRRYHLAQIGIPLVRYNPIRAELVKLAAVDVAVTFGRKDMSKAGSALVRRPDKIGRARVRKLVINFEEAGSAYETVVDTDKSTAGAKSGGDDPNSVYAIITTSYIETNSTKLDNFVSHKEAMGFDVQVITGADFGGGTGDTAAENIRSWLQSNYETGNIEYALLIGSPDPCNGNVPMKMLWPRYGAESDEEAPSDLYYADLTGDWDLDGDGYYAEWDGDFGTGGVDRFFEVIVGRIPYYGSIGALDAILQKLIDYELDYGEDEQWRKNVLIPSNPLSLSWPGYRIGEQLKYSILEPARWSSHRIYDEDYDLVPPPETTPCTYANVLDVWTGAAENSDGQFGLVVWSAHGGPYGAEDIIVVPSVDELDDNYPSFTFQASCRNAWPEDPCNISYVLLKNGGICTIGATRNSWYLIGWANYNDQEEDNMAYEYTWGLVRDRLSCGKSLHDLRQVYDPLESEGWMNFLVFNIYGDPSLRIIRSEPEDHEAVTYYVDATEGSDDANGLSWDNAFRDLQDALAVAIEDDRIWVAQGVYAPTEPDGDRGISFRPAYYVSIYGGFPTGGGDWDDRDPNEYNTILSGDLNGNDVGELNDPSRDENSYHVLIGSSEFILDGFTITGGNANGYQAVQSSGGGMILSHCDATFENCTFAKNYAKSGGAILNCYYSWPTFINCTFAENAAGDSGGAIFSVEANATMTNCTFISNSAGGHEGGAIKLGYGTFVLTGCTFIQNSAARWGGAIYQDRTTSTLTGCTFTGNSALNGGAVKANKGKASMTNCSFQGNWTFLAGGYFDGIGGALIAEFHELELQNCIFSGNRAASYGGGAYLSHCEATLTNCTIVGNSAEATRDGYYGDGVYTVGGDACMNNCIFWSNEHEQVSRIGALSVTYSCVEDGWAGVGNIDTDPCFVDPGHWDPNNTPSDPNDDFWVDGDYHLRLLSPCFNTGDPCSDYTGQTDMDGDPRVRYGRVDMGADELFPLGCDFEGDEDVDLADFTAFAVHWARTDCSDQNDWCRGADFNYDGAVNLADVLIFAKLWLFQPGQML